MMDGNLNKTEARMLRWMYAVTQKEMVDIVYIRRPVGMVDASRKVIEMRLKWFEHV